MATRAPSTSGICTRCHWPASLLGRHIDDIAHRQHIGGLFDFRAEFLAIDIGPGPAHQRHRNDAGFARRFRLAVGQQFWLEADGRLLFIHLGDNGETPGGDIGGGTRLIKQQRPNRPGRPLS